MRGVMASNSSSLTHNVHAPSRPPPRDRSPDPPAGRSGCCTGFLCLGSLKRGKRIAPATRLHDGSNTSPRPWASNGGAQQSGPANQYATLSPSLLAPPSSPASFQNSAVQSSAQSPCSFPVVSVPSATSQIPLERAQTMFQMGPYAHETALVSPPVFSNFTTAPSTAPFTPPPELANTHLTTPSSPDVPFAQLLANSFGTKQAVRSQPARTYSALPFSSPDIFERDDLQVAYQLYHGSPLAHLLSPASGTGASTPFPDLEPPTPVQAVASMFFPGSPLIQQDPPSKMELQVLNSCSFQDLGGEGEQQLPASISSFLASGDDSSRPKVAEYAERLIVGLNKGSDECHVIEQALVGSAPQKDGLEEEKSAQVAEECISKQDNDTGVTGLVFADGISSTQLEQSKHESSDQADRNLSEGAPFILSFTEASNKSPSAGTGPPHDSSSVDQEIGNRGFSDEVDRNLTETAIRSVSSSDILNKSPGTGNGVLCDIPSGQQKEGTCEFSSEAARNVNQIDESTCEGSSGSDDITFARLGQCKQNLSNEVDRNVYEIVTFNLVRTRVSSKFPCESNGSSDDVPSVQQEPGKSEDCSDELERNLRQTVLGLLGSTLSSNNNSRRQANGLVESNGTPVQTLVHPATSLLGPTVGDFVAWETSVGDKIPAKLSISKISLMESSRTGSAIHSRSCSRDSSSGRLSNGRTSPVTRLSNGRTSPVIRLSSGGTSPVTCLSNGGTSAVIRLSTGGTSPVTCLSNGGTAQVFRLSNGGTSPATRLSSGGTSPVSRLSNGGKSPVIRLSSGGTSPGTRLSSGGTSPVSRLSNGGTCSDCVRLQNVAVAGSEGYFDVAGSQQFTFTGQNFEAEPNCNRETSQDCSGIEKPQRERGVLKVLLEHTMEMPVGIEGLDRDIYKEQQLKLPVNWIQSGAKLHQRGVDSVSRELSELGGTCSGSQTGPSTQLGMSLVAELK